MSQTITIETPPRGHACASCDATTEPHEPIAFVRDDLSPLSIALCVPCATDLARRNGRAATAPQVSP